MAEIVDFNFRVNFKIPLKLTLLRCIISVFMATCSNEFQRLRGTVSTVSITDNSHLQNLKSRL